MVWNYHDADKQGKDCNVKILVKGLPAKKMVLTEYRIDKEHSNSYEEWKKMGSPQNPTNEQVTELEKSGKLQAIVNTGKLGVVDGNAQILIALPRQGVSLLKIKW